MTKRFDGAPAKGMRRGGESWRIGYRFLLIKFGVKKSILMSPKVVIVSIKITIHVFK
jgi:hypothetical protein